MPVTDGGNRSRGARLLVGHLLGAVAVALAAGAGCATSAGPVRLKSNVLRPKKAVVVFFVDGLQEERLHQMLDAGELPNIKQRFVDGGVSVDHAVTVLPSITYAVSVSMLTGLYPGHHGILGNRWFDPYSCIARYYITATTYRTVNEHFHQPTLYEVVDDCFTVSVQFHTRRGVKYTLDNAVPTGIDYFLHAFWLVDRRVGACVKDIERLARQVGRWPVIYWSYFPGNDETAHHDGPDSPEYGRELRTIDTSIGQVLEGVKAAGMADSTYYVLISDHGHNKTGPGQGLDLADWLAKSRDLRVFEGTITQGDYPSRLRRIQPYDAVVLTGAFRRVAIYLRGRDGWGTPADPDDVQAIIDDSANDGAEPLWSLPAVAVVCRRLGDDEVEVLSRAGKVVVQRRRIDGKKQYRLVAPANGGQTSVHMDDVLGYNADPQLAAFVTEGWHEAYDWLAKTATADFPDFVPQVVEMFDSPRAGDIVVFASDGWSFEPGWASGHGSCIAADMNVPMYFAGPNLPAGGHIEYARVVDVMPTIVDLLGHANRLDELGRLDGRSIAPQLRAAVVNDGDVP